MALGGGGGILCSNEKIFENLDVVMATLVLFK